MKRRGRSIPRRFFLMRTACTLTLLLALGNTALAMDKPDYRLTLDARVKDHQLTMAPRIHAPAGIALSYEVIVSRTGASGITSTRQSGPIRVNDHNTATLSKLSLSIRPQDRCTILVKVFDGSNVVAERSYSYPEKQTGTH